LSRRLLRREWRVRTPTLLLGAIVIVAAGAGVWRTLAGREEGETPTTVAFTVTLPRDLRLATVNLFPVAVSPDGKTVVYRASRGEASQLYVRRLGDVEHQPILGTEGAVRPFFSSDGEWIAFTVSGKLKRVSLHGGPVIEMGDVNGRAAWGGGMIVFGDAPGQLYTMPATGGGKRALTRLDTTRGELPRSPVVLEDGETILYASSRAGQTESRLGIASMKNAESHLLDVTGLLFLGVLEGHVIYVSADGTLRAAPIDLRARKITGAPIPLIRGIAIQGTFAGAALGGGTLAYVTGSAATELLRVDETGNAQPLLRELGGYALPRVSPDRRRLAIAIKEGRRENVWVYDFASATLSRVSADSSATFPEWIPPGDEIAFARGRSRINAEVVVQSRDGSGSPRKVISDKNFHYFAVHPNGKTIVYTVFPDGNRRDPWLWTRQLTGDTTPTVLPGSGPDEWAYRFSPDGRWMAYVLSDEAGDRVYVRPYPGPGPRVQLSNGNATEPVWSHDGRTVFYRDIVNRKMIAVDLALSPEPTVVARRQLFDDQFDDMWDVAGYDRSPDDKGFIMVRERQEARQLVVISNWRQLLRERLAQRR
jgi:Tol biopolymer transport system component